MRTRLFYVLMLLASLLAAVPMIYAQNVPMHIILPIGAGSGVDTIVRTAQTSLSKYLNQPVVIENLPGAGGISGTQALVKAAPDGNTIAFISNNHAVNPSVFKSLPYDSLKDITPISVVGGSAFLLVTNPQKIKAVNAKELVNELKAKNSNFNYGSSGNGTVIHLGSAMFLDATGAQATHVPYKGMGPMLTDIIGGQVDFGIAASSTVQGYLKNGSLRAIGVMHKSRISSMPNLPTIAEQGFPEVDISGWFAVIGPSKLPAQQVKRIYEAVVAAFNDPEVKATLGKTDTYIQPMSPEASARYLKSEQDRYAKLVAKAGVHLD